MPVQLVSKIFNLCGPDPPTSQIDGQTDKQMDDMQSQHCALHYSASRGKNMHLFRVSLVKTVFQSRPTLKHSGAWRVKSVFSGTILISSTDAVFVSWDAFATQPACRSFLMLIDNKMDYLFYRWEWSKLSSTTAGWMFLLSSWQQTKPKHIHYNG